MSSHKVQVIEHEKETSVRINTHTIHSVKGETHRSELLLDEIESKTLTKILINQFNGGTDKKTCSEEEIINRNLLYVAMSRPTHLFVFAMHHEELTEELIQIFKKTGWGVIDV